MTSTMKTWQILLLGILLGVLVAGLIILLSAPPRGRPITLVTAEPGNPAGNNQSSSEAEKVILVHVAGAVNNPGLWPLHQGTRVNDAISAAGGTTANADVNRVNLAATLTDGSRVYIPQIGEYVTDEDLDISSVLAKGGLIDINLANRDELTSLPAIGTAKADAIIAYRQTHGDFTTIEDIMDVAGIGQSIFDQIKNLITTGN